MILHEIAQRTRERVQKQKAKLSTSRMEAQAAALPSMTGFPFEQALAHSALSFICEVKKASPSMGVIAADFPYLSIAHAYEQAGAAAISVLTEPYYFQGASQYLQEIAAAVRLPVLRKDFIVDTYQIYEAKCLGASAVLLICALLDTETLKSYLALTHDLGLSALVEAHDEVEIAVALAAGARVIGVNNRNLNDFTVDLDNSRRLRALVPPDLLFVAESGIKTAQDVRLLREAGVNAVLIGELLMKSPDKKAALTALRGL